ncbi:MAG: RDD family protein [Pyrinomonadaceae bacterium]
MATTQHSVPGTQHALPDQHAPPAQHFAGRTRQVRAPFLMRCGALTIDYIIILFPVIISIIVIHIIGGGAPSRNSFAVSAIEILGYSFTAIIAVLDLFFLTWSTGRTIGKWITGLRVISVQTSSPPNMRQIMLRYLVGFPVSLLTLGLGFLLAAVNKRGRALHDFFGSTIVVYEG